MKSLVLSLMMFSVFTLYAQPADGAWAAGDPVASVQSGAWTEASTWDCECVPSNSNDVAIQSGHSIILLEGDTARAESLAISEGGTVELPAGARIELSAAFSSVGDIIGRGAVALVGEGPHVCGPASLEHLICGSSSVSCSDTVTVRSQIDLADATVNTNEMLVLQGHAGFTGAAGSVMGEIQRQYTWEKQTPFVYLIGSGLEGAVAEDLLDLPGALNVKSWDEPSTSYLNLTGEDELPVGLGMRCALTVGTHEELFTGSPVLGVDWPFKADAEMSDWRGWNLMSNPLTGFVDLGAAETVGPGSLGTTYTWVDSLSTYAAQVNGLGQYGRNGILAPGEAFWTIVDTTFNLALNSSALVDKRDWEHQDERYQNSVLQLQLEVGDRIEQCVIDFGGGSEGFVYGEDAPFTSSWRGRNDLDLFSESADDVHLMVNRTSSDIQVIPIWVKAMEGESVTIKAPRVPGNRCLSIEDVETGAVQSIDMGLSYEFPVDTSGEHHRFNVIVGGSLNAISMDASCASAMDGSIAVQGPDVSSVFSLLDDDGVAVGIFEPDSTGGVFVGLGTGVYTLISISDDCADLTQAVEIAAGTSGLASFEIEAQPDHIGCYDDHGGVVLEIEGGLAPYTVEWSHGATGTSIEVDNAGILDAIITDAAGCSDSTTVEVLAAPQVEAGIGVEQAVVTLIDGEAEVHFENTSSGATAYQWNFGDGGSSIAESPVHAYTEVGAYTVGLNAWNDFCSDTYQMVVTVETVSSVGAVLAAIPAAISRNNGAWEVRHPEEAFTVEVFDLTGRMVYRTGGTPGIPAILDPAMLPPVALVHWIGATSGRQQTWRVAR